MKDIRNFRIRILSRGDSDEPIAPDAQVVVFEVMARAYVGTMEDWYPGSTLKAPALCVVPENYDPATTQFDGGGAFWNADATASLHLLCPTSFDYGELLPAPRHGYRLTYEEAE